MRSYSGAKMQNFGRPFLGGREPTRIFTHHGTRRVLLLCLCTRKIDICYIYIYIYNTNEKNNGKGTMKREMCYQKGE